VKTLAGVTVVRGTLIVVRTVHKAAVTGVIHATVHRATVCIVALNVLVAATRDGRAAALPFQTVVSFGAHVAVVAYYAAAHRRVDTSRIRLAKVAGALIAVIANDVSPGAHALLALVVFRANIAIITGHGIEVMCTIATVGLAIVIGAHVVVHAVLWDPCASRVGAHVGNGARVVIVAGQGVGVKYATLCRIATVGGAMVAVVAGHLQADAISSRAGILFGAYTAVFARVRIELVEALRTVGRGHTYIVGARICIITIERITDTHAATAFVVDRASIRIITGLGVVGVLASRRGKAGIGGAMIAVVAVHLVAHADPLPAAVVGGAHGRVVTRRIVRHSGWLARAGVRVASAFQAVGIFAAIAYDLLIRIDDTNEVDTNGRAVAHVVVVITVRIGLALAFVVGSADASALLRHALVVGARIGVVAQLPRPANAYAPRAPVAQSAGILIVANLIVGRGHAIPAALVAPVVGTNVAVVTHHRLTLTLAGHTKIRC